MKFFYYLSVLSVVFLVLFGSIIFLSSSKSTYLDTLNYNDIDEIYVLEIIDFLFEGEELTSFTEDEVEHMIDVLGLINLGVIFLVLAVAIFVFSLAYGFYNDNFKFLYYGGLIGLFLNLLIFLIAFFDFNIAFKYFHEIFFKDNWMFPSSYLLIRVFPIEFFVEKSIKIFFTNLFFCVISLVCYYKCTR